MRTNLTAVRSTGRREETRPRRVTCRTYQKSRSNSPELASPATLSKSVKHTQLAQTCMGRLLRSLAQQLTFQRIHFFAGFGVLAMFPLSPVQLLFSNRKSSAVWRVEPPNLHRLQRWLLPRRDP